MSHDEASPAPFALIDRNLQVVAIDPHLAAHVELRPAAAAGRPLAEVLPALAPAWEPLLRQVIATGAAVRGVPLPAPAEAHRGPQRALAVQLCPVLSRGGLVVGVDILLDDAGGAPPPAAPPRAGAQLQAILAAAADGLMLLDSVRDGAGRIVDFRRRHGSPAARPSGGPPGRRLPAALGEMVFAALARVAETGEPWTAELAGPGEGAGSSIRLVAARADDGVAVALSDLSERRRAEERLRRLQTVTARFAEAQTLDEVRRVLVETVAGAMEANSITLRLVTPAGLVVEDIGHGEAGGHQAAPPDPVIALDGPHPAAEVARTGQALCFTSAEALRRQFADVAPLAQLPFEASGLLPLLRGRSVFGVLTLTFPEPHAWEEGERAFAQSVAHRAAVAFDRARLFEAERAAHWRLEETSAQLEAILAHAPVGILVARAPGGELLGANPQAERILRRQLDPAGGVSIPPDYAAATREGRRLTPAEWPLTRSLRTGEVVAGEELDIRGGDGVPVTVLVSSAPIRDERQQVIGAVVVLADVTERRIAERERERLLAREQELRQQAEEASRLKDEFLATVSHELRTPLTALLGHAQLLRRRQRDEAYVARAVERMAQSAQVQAQLIEDLLDVAGMVSGKLRLEPQQLSLVPVIHAALETVRAPLEARGLQLALQLDPAAGTVMGDAGRLQQMVWNLLSNAVKFTPPGGRISVGLERDDGFAVLRVSDTGQGIEPAFLPFVFDRFRQADGSSYRAQGGLGLGLAIVRHIVELHGGGVVAESRGPGRGATFLVRLPLARDDGAGGPAPRPADTLTARGGPAALRGLRVLLVDDQPAILDLLQDILGPSGAELRAATSARGALELIRAWQPDVLVADIAMPGEDGYWLIEQVRALPADAGGQIPALALTAYVRMEDRMRTLRAGFQLYVPKPVDPVELQEAIIQIVRP